jgi:predicted nucleotidyltransferase
MSANTEMLIRVARGLKQLADEMVFVEGAVAELYADDPAATEIRPTKDVDCVVEISTRAAYYDLEEKLRQLGFVNDRTKFSLICRWTYEDIIVDIMPTNEKILGFSNRWYEAGIANKISQPLTDDLSIFTFSLPYYLSSKFEAMNSRGSNDLRTSHDFEDIIYVMDNSINLYETLKAANAPDVKQYLADECSKLLNNSNISECITAVLPYGMDERLEVIEDLLTSIRGL